MNKFKTECINLIARVKSSAFLKYGLLAGFIFIANAVSPVRFTMVGSPSITMGIYILNELDTDMVRGRSYCFDNYAPEWAHPELHIPSYQITCKYLIGMPGDLIESDNDLVRLTYTGEGDAPRQLSSIVREFPRLHESEGAPVGYAALPDVIPEGSYYLGSDYPKGWDSRYLGTIASDLILGRATLLYEFSSSDE